MIADLDVVEAGIPLKDGCPVLTRIKAFICQEGVPATIQYVMRDRIGRPISLYTSFEDVSGSVSMGVSESLTAADTTILARFAEFSGTMHDTGQPWPVEGRITDASNGVIQAKLPKQVYTQAGIYRVSFAFLGDGVIKLVQNALVSVERSLWGGQPGAVHYSGPPTLNELRMQMMDSSGAENSLLFDVEFDDEQIVTALAKPIREFNESQPPLNVSFSTWNFPWKEHWLDAAVGYLLQFAAHNYRRNHLQITGGGKSLDDKNREREYLQASQMLLEKWREFILLKRAMINAQAATGTVGSDYGRYFPNYDGGY